MNRQILTRITSYAGIIVVVVGLIAIVVLVAIGRSPPSTVTEYGTWILAIITLGYVIQTGQILRESRRERQLTRDTLKQMQKEPIIKLVARGIDELLNGLKSDYRQLEKEAEDSDMEPLPLLYTHHPPSDKVLEDIDAKVSGIVNEIEHYYTKRERYRDSWISLRDELENAIGNSLTEETQKELCDGLRQLEPFDSRASRNELLGRLNNAGTPLAELVLDPTFERFDSGDVTAKNWITDNLTDVTAIVTVIRDDERYKSDFEELLRHKSELKQQNSTITTRVEQAREEYLDEYDILNAEIEDYTDE